MDSLGIKSWKLSVVVAFLLFAFACSTNKQESEVEEKEPLEMPKNSEMAKVMRQMQSDMEFWKAALDKDSLPAVSGKKLHHAAIMLPETTMTPGFERDESFEKMATTYVELVNDFVNNPSIEGYELARAGCVTCHQVKCQGPLVAINQLKINP